MVYNKTYYFGAAHQIAFPKDNFFGNWVCSDYYAQEKI
jgi:hypothetical protein